MSGSRWRGPVRSGPSLSVNLSRPCFGGSCAKREGKGVAAAHPLIELARAPTPAARVALLRSISDLFFQRGVERNASEMLLFEEIATRVVREVGSAERTGVSEALANESMAPRGLVLLLAGDEASVAAPVLECSTVFSDQDLIAIARRSSDGHLRAICRRSSLAEMVTDVLVRRGSEIVLRLVAANPGATFSIGAFDELVRRSQDDELLQLGLARRRDLPGPTIEALACILTDRLRVRMVASGYDNPDALAPGLLARLRTSLSLVVEERGRDMQALDRVVQEIRADRVSVKRVIDTLARGDRGHDLAALVAALVDIDQATVVEILTGPIEEPLVVLFRAVNAPWEAFEAVLQMRARHSRQPYGRSPVLAQTYAEMDSMTAERVLRFIQARRSDAAAGETGLNATLAKAAIKTGARAY